MKHWLRLFGIAVLTFHGLLDSAQAVYANSNPMAYVDPPGLAPGDTFPSRDGAAQDAGAYARGLPSQFLEHGGWIYPQGGGYTYNLGRGAPAGMPRKKMAQLKDQCAATPTDAWHTHPDPGNPDPFANNFSDDDREFARNSGVPVYLKTPMGSTIVFDPITNSTRRLK